MTTPRVFLARHGETEWTLNGRHTGITEIPLTPRGETQVRQAARSLVGAGRLIDPARLARVYVSPRVRAQRTLELLLPSAGAEVEVRRTEAVAEWGYGRYEGWVPARIREDRRARGLDADRPFDIWRDGCEDGEEAAGGLKGESAAEVRGRLDAVIAEIRALQGPWLGVGGGGGGTGVGVDVLVVSHGHLLRAFTKRWLGLELDFPLQMILEPGGIATLTYNHHSIDEPAFLLGGVFKDPTADADADVGGAE